MHPTAQLLGIPTILDAAALITTGQCDVVLVAAGGAGVHTERTSTAPWTRPTNELVVGYGLFTAAEFALMARRHMLDVRHYARTDGDGRGHHSYQWPRKS